MRGVSAIVMILTLAGCQQPIPKPYPEIYLPAPPPIRQEHETMRSRHRVLDKELRNLDKKVQGLRDKLEDREAK